MWSSLILVLAAGASASARVLDTLAAVPRGWEEVRTASPDEPIFLRVALQHHPQHTRALDQAVLDMSTPGHASYGMHMTRDELRSYTAPSDDAVAAVTGWLHDHAIQPVVDHDWVSFTTTVRTANQLLDTQFAWYKYLDGLAAPALRALSYSVPDAVAAHISLVQPTTRFGSLSARRSAIFDMHPLELDGAAAAQGSGSRTLDSSDCTSTVTPDCLRKLYDIHYKPVKPADNKVAFASFLEEYARYDDLKAFEKRLVPDAVGLNFSVELINNGLNDQSSNDDSSEANLDAQYLLALSYPIPMVEYSVGGRGPLVPTADQPTQPGSNEPYLEFLLHMAFLPDSALPQTISTSYGEEEQSVPREYALKICDMFRDLGARGVSVIFASGDSGPGNSCVRTVDNATFFEPTFPAACPWVTSVGGTTSLTNEKAVSFSSGGFSIYHARPEWQKDAVEGYLQTIGDAYAPFFNRSGRGFPDVSAQATRFSVSNRGYWGTIGGTSASAPVFAGIVALLNAARKASGDKPMGFLNPWLYNHSKAFTDITAGAGWGCMERDEFEGGGRGWGACGGGRRGSW